MNLENIIYYLVFNDERTSIFYQLAQKFQEVGIILVPIEMEDFKNIEFHQKKITLVVIESNFKMKILFRKFIKDYLMFMLKRKLLNLYHLSSFSSLVEIDVGISNLSYYKFGKLPILVDDIVLMIKDQYFKNLEIEKKWPGGIKVKLPNDILDL